MEVVLWAAIHLLLCQREEKCKVLDEGMGAAHLIKSLVRLQS